MKKGLRDLLISSSLVIPLVVLPSNSQAKINSNNLKQVKQNSLDVHNGLSSFFYEVQKGDNLTEISEKFGLRSWKKLYEDNKEQINKNTFVIYPGERLIIKNATQIPVGYVFDGGNLMKLDQRNFKRKLIEYVRRVKELNTKSLSCEKKNNELEKKLNEAYSKSKIIDEYFKDKKKIINYYLKLRKREEVLESKKFTQVIKSKKIDVLVRKGKDDRDFNGEALVTLGSKYKLDPNGKKIPIKNSGIDLGVSGGSGPIDYYKLFLGKTFGITNWLSFSGRIGGGGNKMKFRESPTNEEGIYHLYHPFGFLGAGVEFENKNVLLSFFSNFRFIYEKDSGKYASWKFGPGIINGKLAYKFPFFNKLSIIAYFREDLEQKAQDSFGGLEYNIFKGLNITAGAGQSTNSSNIKYPALFGGLSFHK